MQCVVFVDLNVISLPRAFLSHFHRCTCVFCFYILLLWFHTYNFGLWFPDKSVRQTCKSMWLIYFYFCMQGKYLHWQEPNWLQLLFIFNYFVNWIWSLLKIEKTQIYEIIEDACPLLLSPSSQLLQNNLDMILPIDTRTLWPDPRKLSALAFGPHGQKLRNFF